MLEQQCRMEHTQVLHHIPYHQLVGVVYEGLFNLLVGDNRRFGIWLRLPGDESSFKRSRRDGGQESGSQNGSDTGKDVHTCLEVDT